MGLSESIVYAGGTFVPYGEAKVGLLTHGLNYGTGCFEGIRGFWSGDDGELNLLHLREHYERLLGSTKTLLMTVPHDLDRLCELTIELCLRNRFQTDVYVRPLVYKAAEDVGVRLSGVPDAFSIVVLPFAGYYQAPEGLKCGVSSWRRIDDTMAPARAKITGSYINSALAKSEAQLNGFDEAILLSHDGHVAEGSAANLFVVRSGVLYTPDPTQNVLEGITRRAVLTIARDLGIPTFERPLDRSELYAADEAFFTGTAASISHIASVDHRPVADGAMGPITRRLSETFERITAGREPLYRSWLTPVYGRRGKAFPSNGTALSAQIAGV